MTTRAAVFGGILAVAFSVACVAGAQERGGYSVTQVSTMLKLRQSDKPGVTTPADVRLWAARGEAESAQLAIHAAEPLTNVEVKASALAGPEGVSLQPAVSLVGYVPVVTPTPGGFGEPGDYPDPLLPLQAFSVDAGKTRSLWITVRVPLDTRTGEYTGTVSIRPAGLSQTDVPVVVTVVNVKIPRRSALHTWAPSWGQGASKYAYGDAWNDERARAFEAQLLDYRLTSPPPLPWKTVFSKGSNGEWQADWSVFDRAVEEQLEKGANAFRLEEVFPWFGQPVDLTSPDDVAARADRAAKLRLADAHLTEKQWTQYFHLYIFDEPTISPDYPNPGDTIGPENVEKIKAMARFIHESAPNLRLMFVTCDPAYEAVALDFPAYVWVEHINHYHADFQDRRRAMGEPGWMYMCLTTKYVPTYPDIWRIDRHGMSHRAIGWWLFRYHCDGFLYWCVDYWDKQDVFKNPDLYGATSGDGFLFYPNLDKQGPVLPSIRVEIARDGFEDFDLLVLLRDAVARMESAPQAANNLLERARKLLNLDDVISAPDVFAEDPAVYEMRHRDMLEALGEIGARN